MVNDYAIHPLTTKINYVNFLLAAPVNKYLHLFSLYYHNHHLFSIYSMSDHSLHQDLLQSAHHDNGDSPSDDSASPPTIPTDAQIMGTPNVQIQVLQQSPDQNIAVQSLLGQEIATAQLAFANLPVTRQQEVLAACQQQLLQSIRSTLPTAQGIVVPSAVQNVTVVATNPVHQQGKL